MLQTLKTHVHRMCVWCDRTVDVNRAAHMAPLDCTVIALPHMRIRSCHPARILPAAPPPLANAGALAKDDNELVTHSPVTSHTPITARAAPLGLTLSYYEDKTDCYLQDDLIQFTPRVNEHHVHL